MFVDIPNIIPIPLELPPYKFTSLLSCREHSESPELVTNVSTIKLMLICFLRNTCSRLHYPKHFQNNTDCLLTDLTHFLETILLKELIQELLRQIRPCDH